MYLWKLYVDIAIFEDLWVLHVIPDEAFPETGFDVELVSSLFKYQDKIYAHLLTTIMLQTITVIKYISCDIIMTKQEHKFSYNSTEKQKRKEMYKICKWLFFPLSTSSIA